METLIGIITNVFSIFLYDKIGIWKNRKAIQHFQESLIGWVEGFLNKNETTIVARGIFITYVDDFSVIIKIFRYVSNYKYLGERRV